MPITIAETRAFSFTFALNCHCLYWSIQMNQLPGDCYWYIKRVMQILFVHHYCTANVIMRNIHQNKIKQLWSSTPRRELAKVIQVLVENKHNNLVGINELMESQPSPFDMYNSNGNIDIQNNLHRYASTQENNITKITVEYNVSMFQNSVDNTTSGVVS